ncbi:hypothetical protein [Sphingomonas montanisoli]|uniref:DUF429 domain-containing protein n=1 Tax=Sphingomonas montanisoli TaxID=2606412 RepID=A0A5D9C215_9SPHN|nr:hypothetical protein [Sphingomonas montanisoli]TZG25639.1 hypothetical protein FYJ91_11480 [Sphingomonas montanisoli]
MRAFTRFACIDWSGQAVERPKGIAVAVAEGRNAPVLLDHAWSRQDVADWLIEQSAAKADLLVGFDFSMALPFLDMGAYLPGWPDGPVDARALWALIDHLSADDRHLAATGFVDHPEVSRHFRRHGGREGDLFGGGMGRMRLTEQACRAGGHGNAISCFNLVGAAQVGKSSLTGMRMLHQLTGRIPVWPFDPVPEKGPMIVELYTSIAARAAGLGKGRSKMRDAGALAAALLGWGLETPMLARYDDHATDAIVGAAWLARAADDAALWHPPALTPEVAAIEGWTFGVP